MCSYWLAWPHRTYLLCRVVANSKDKIEFRSTGFGKFAPIFAAQAIRRQFCRFNLANSGGMNFAFRMTPGTVSRESRESLFLHDRFGHDGPGGVSRTQKQNVIAVAHIGLVSVTTAGTAARFFDWVGFHGADESTHEFPVHLWRDSIRVHPFRSKKLFGICRPVDSSRFHVHF